MSVIPAGLARLYGGSTLEPKNLPCELVNMITKMTDLKQFETWCLVCKRIFDFVPSSPSLHHRLVRALIADQATPKASLSFFKRLNNFFNQKVRWGEPSHFAGFRQMAIHPNEKSAAISLEQGHIKIIDLYSGHCWQSLTLAGEEVTDLVFYDNSHAKSQSFYLVIGTLSGKVFAYELGSGRSYCRIDTAEREQRLFHYATTVHKTLISPDGVLCVTLMQDYLHLFYTVFSLVNGARGVSYNCGDPRLYGFSNVVATSTRECLACTFSDNKLVLSDLKVKGKNKLVGRDLGLKEIGSLILSPDAKTVAISGLWKDGRDARKFFQIEGESLTQLPIPNIGPIAFSADGKRVFQCSSSTLQVVDLQTYSTVVLAKGTFLPYKLFCSPHGTTLCLVECNNALTVYRF